ncbi:hypothetical protein BOTBODRAFT_192706 [Botryobasidium botryosum FD-172 SS1]|uniref:Cystinosin n=1 Tax=Botryobasidium botryosum (strain FD-172 SS1) TaxID=930990 RepID=A0A067M620_BOTB1|nr:hypothetical protein BOTBODRAFT_192706 [Botryobasidium botryosum FD-172 SS1]
MVASTNYEILSQVIGWSYFCSWSLSLYPQAILNWRRKSVDGLSIDYATLNSLGHLSYAIYNLNFYLNPTVRREYRERHQGHESSVQSNDVAFSIHAALTSAFVLAQTFWYPRGLHQGLSKYNKYLLTIVFAAVSINTFAVVGCDSLLIDLLYNLSLSKLYVTIAKFVPQAWLNYSRKSTVGWSIENIILDFSGGVLSLMQLFLDASVSDDWSSVTGNPVKLGLWVFSIAFTLLFIVQHFILYTNHADEKLKQLDVERVIDECAPLLPHDI